MVLCFHSADDTLACDHSNESYRVVLSCGTVNCALHVGSNFKVCDLSSDTLVPEARYPNKWENMILINKKLAV